MLAIIFCKCRGGGRSVSGLTVTLSPLSKNGSWFLTVTLSPLVRLGISGREDVLCIEFVHDECPNCFRTGVTRQHETLNFALARSPLPRRWIPNAPGTLLSLLLEISL
jgi:hypothetical protein